MDESKSICEQKQTSRELENPPKRPKYDFVPSDDDDTSPLSPPLLSSTPQPEEQETPIIEVSNCPVGCSSPDQHEYSPCETPPSRPSSPVPYESSPWDCTHGMEHYSDQHEYSPCETPPSRPSSPVPWDCTHGMQYYSDISECSNTSYYPESRCSTPLSEDPMPHSEFDCPADDESESTTTSYSDSSLASTSLTSLLESHHNPQLVTSLESLFEETFGEENTENVGDGGIEEPILSEMPHTSSQPESSIDASRMEPMIWRAPKPRKYKRDADGLLRKATN